MLKPNLSYKSRQVREEFFPDFAILYSESQIRGTFDGGRYYFKIYRLLWHIYINISETEYGLVSETPINIASYSFGTKYDRDQISSKINMKKY